LMLTDGVSKSSVFMLATVNEKKFLDQAATRPCRWDYIIDTGAPHPSQYMTLIKERCQNEKVVDLFTEAVCRTMGGHNVSGAFVVNLLGHLELTYRLSPEKLSEEYVILTIERMHKSFYRAPEAKEQSVGFAAN
jgi:SpoVK/Ycf46/Vps4 family AAA+-type ATPase